MEKPFKCPFSKSKCKCELMEFKLHENIYNNFCLGKYNCWEKVVINGECFEPVNITNNMDLIIYLNWYNKINKKEI